MRWTFVWLDAASRGDLGGGKRLDHSVSVRIVVVIAFLLGCGAGPQVARPTTGGIAGLARDQASGDPIMNAEISVPVRGAVRSTRSSDRGLYDIQELPPGRYRMRATFAGQPIEVTNIVVRAGEITMVDLKFTLGRPGPIRIDLEGAKSSEIDRYRPKGLPDSVAQIEGTVNDLASRQRVAGTVVTAVYARDASVHQTVTDDHGRFRFDALPPGTYTISAYYSIGGRGQIEVRRSGIAIDGAEAVVVPLWIEMER